MKDQHTKIKGYRDLSQEEIDLMNAIKEHAEHTEDLVQKVAKLRVLDKADGINSITDEQFEESIRCLDIAKTNLQTGQMWFVRSVALPNSF